MLFTDSDWITGQDLKQIDPLVTAVAKTEQIVLDTQPGAIVGGLNQAEGICAAAAAEVGQKIQSVTNAFSGYQPPFAMPYNQSMAVINIVGPSVERQRISLSQVVVSNPSPGLWSPFKRWGVYEALALFYRTASIRKQNDLYEKRRDYYEDEIRKRYWPRAFKIGCPVVNKPMARPGASHEYNAGIWSADNVNMVAGSNADANTAYDVAITYVDQSLYLSQPTSANANARMNAESEISQRISVLVQTDEVITISIAGLNPPNGQAPINVSLGQGLVVPLNATGWNVWIGQTNGPLWLQNASPIPITTLEYTLTGPPVLSGFGWLGGQFPDAYWTMQQTLMRG